MAGNRVEELEETVRALQATVDGLTDELIETKERLRHVESHLDADELEGIIEGRTSRAQARDTVAKQPVQGDGGTTSETRTPENQDAVEAAVEGAVGESADGSATAADEGKSAEAEGEEESADQSDDIIVA